LEEVLGHVYELRLVEVVLETGGGEVKVGAVVGGEALATVE
jgi:hypothetical protein